MEQITLQWQNFWNFVGQTDVGNEEKGLRFKKIVLFWQNIWNSRKIAAEIKEKLPDHEEALCRGIKLIYLCLSKKWKPCHGCFNVTSDHHWKSTFDFTETLNCYGRVCQLVRFIPSFSLKLDVPFWKYFDSMILGSEGKDYCPKNKVLDFWPKFFG